MEPENWEWFNQWDANDNYLLLDPRDETLR